MGKDGLRVVKINFWVMQFMLAKPLNVTGRQMSSD